MKVAVIGLGYTGTVLAACLADAGHSVMGIDCVAGKVAAIRGGRSPVKEPGLGDLVREGVGRGTLAATDNVEEALSGADLVAVCVGTPSLPSGGLDATAVGRVVLQIADVRSRLGRTTNPLTIAIRSTLMPGTARHLQQMIAALHPDLSKNGGVSLAVWPEFLREGRALEDFRSPSLTVVGHDSPQVVADIAALLGENPASIHRTSFESAEATKIACNAFHAAKVTFANEIGRYCDAVGADGHHVMRLLAADHRLNISAAYLEPGFAFGGSCLPKDVRAIVAHAQLVGVTMPMLEQLLPSNALQIRRVVEHVRMRGWKRIAIIGIAFKPHTDDLRESPYVTLARDLLEMGVEVSLYDETVDCTQLSGENLVAIMQRLPALEYRLAPSLQQAVLHADAVVIGSHDRGEVQRMTPAGVPVVDLKEGALS